MRILYQDEEVHKIEDVQNKEFPTMCEPFVHNKLSIHFGEGKTKCILFSNIKRFAKLNMIYGDHDIK